jgi:HK97 family phage major capsid protein
MPEEKEILEKMNDVAEAVKVIQDTQEKHAGKLDALDTEKVNTAIEAATKGIESIQEERQKEAAEAQALAEQVKELELIVAKGGGSGAPDIDEKEYKHAMNAYLRRGAAMSEEMVEKICKGVAESSVIGAEDRHIEALTKDLVSGSGPDGGYFVMPDRSSSISQRIFETSPLRPIASVVTTTSDIWEQIIDDGEFSDGWVGEVESRPVTNTNEIGITKIPIHETYAMPRVTQKQLDDVGFDLESYVLQKSSSKQSRRQNTAFVVGDGSKKPKGFLTYPDWTTAGTYERDAVEQYDSGSAGSFDGDDLITLQNMLIQDYDVNATWGMKRATFGFIMTLKGSNGQYLLNPRVLSEGADKILLGKPVVLMDDMQAMATDSLSVVYADFREFYTIVDRFGIRLIRDNVTQKPYTLFYTTTRVGGAVTNYEAGKILKLST